MAGQQNGNWHNANGAGLPYRPPPTVDEALQYSPFTSIIPFSPDIIPFPSAEPPTPPSTLSPDQQSAARKAVGILNSEIKGQSTAQHLHETLNQLRELLHRDKLPEYNFKPMPQLATPPPDSPSGEANASKPSYNPDLSPFARLLLKQTDVSFTPFGVSAPKEPQSTPRQAAPAPQIQISSQSQPATPNGLAYPHNANLPYSSSALSSAPSSTPDRSHGPAVVIKQPARQDHRRKEFTRYDNIETPASISQKKKENRQQGESAVLRPHEREIADRKIEDLQDYVAKLLNDKEDPDGSQYFTVVPTSEGDFSVLKPRRMDNLSERMSSVQNLGRFAALPVDLVMQIQSLLHPTILTSTKNDLFSQEDGALELSNGIETARITLKASKLDLDTIIEGRDDHRMRREEIIDFIIDFIKHFKDACIIRVLRSRKSGDVEDFYNAATGFRAELQNALFLCGIVLSRFATIIGKYNLSDRALNALEYLTLEILMEQNAASGDSIFTFDKFEHFRQKAMDVLAQIFARHAEQRTSILNGIFSNLEKLPDKKARHFKSMHEADVMTISALFMRFVQVAAMNTDIRNTAKTTDGTGQVVEDEGSDYETGAASSPTRHKSKGDSAPVRIALNLTANATHIAAHIAGSLVERASNVSKSGDKPFRMLLDHFIEDFCNVLGSPQWPAAVTLLQQLLVRMVNILQADQAAKQSVVDKDMALNALTIIGGGIIAFRQKLRALKRTLDISQSDLSAHLDRLVDQGLSDGTVEGVNNADLLAFDGPYRIVIESLAKYLNLSPNEDDPHLQSVSGCYVSSWLASAAKLFPDQDADAQPQAMRDVQQHLKSMIRDPKWLSRTYNFQAADDKQSKLAAGIITMQSQVCTFLPRLVNYLQTYTRDKNSSRLRSKAMTGLNGLIQKDPRVISEPHIKHMVSAFMDASPMVRKETLSLVATCLAQEPSLERHFLPSILRLTTDPSIAPKKKAIELLKDIYKGPTSRDNKLQIAAALLLPSQDIEKTISDLSLNVLEEIWLTAVPSKARSEESQLRLDRTRRASMMIDFLESIQGNAVRLACFEKFFKYALSKEAKGPVTNLQICKELVADMVDGIISPESGSNARSQARNMNALSIFAKVESTLFTTDQIQLLKLYIKEISNLEDLALVRPTVTIYRHVFPTLPSLQHAFAKEVHRSLMRNLSILAKYAASGQPTSRETLADVVNCLWTISAIPDIGPDSVITAVASTLCNLRPLLLCSKEDAVTQRTKITSWLILLGTFGKYCDFDRYIEKFRSQVAMKARGLPEQLKAPLLNKTTSASLLLLDTVRPFTMQNWEPTIREQALQSLGGICQRSPKLFMRAEVEKVIKLVFINEDNERLKRVALFFFEEYFTVAERRSESGAQIATGEGAVNGSARLETSFVASESDSATLHLGVWVLPKIVNVALKNDNDLAVLATKIIASISRQGLVHPKECNAALVALGTSPNPIIAQIASDEHKRVHEKQESYLEKEIMQAIRIAFRYQVDVYNDAHGMLEASYSPKLTKLFEALKIGKRATTRRFIDNLCKQIDFDLSKLDASDTTPEPLLFARFCLENLALFDFPQLEELAVFLTAVEGIVLKGTGPAVALAIETEMPKQSVASEHALGQHMLENQHQETEAMNGAPQGSGPPPSQIAQPGIGDARLRQITTACMILQMVWETRTFVRRCYNLHKLKGRIPQKEYVKTATRNNFVSGKELWERLTPIMSALDTREAMIKQCYEFADLLEIDREAGIGEEEEATGLGAGYETPPEGDEANGLSFPTSGRGRKRKSNVSLSNTPKKPRGRPAGTKSKKRNSKAPDDDDDSD